MNGRSNRRKRSGVAIVELAIVLLLLSLMTFGMIEFAMTFHVLHCMTNAAREAARELAVRGSTVEQARAVALDRLSHINANFTVTAIQPPNTGPGSHDVTVRISVPRSDISIVALEAFSDKIGSLATLQTEVTMRKEGD